MKRLQEYNKKVIDRSALKNFIDDEGGSGVALIEATAKQVHELLAIDEIIAYWYADEQYTVSFMPRIRKDINYNKDGSLSAGVLTFSSFAFEGENLGTHITISFEFWKLEGSGEGWFINITMEEI